MVGQAQLFRQFRLRQPARLTQQPHPDPQLTQHIVIGGNHKAHTFRSGTSETTVELRRQIEATFDPPVSEAFRCDRAEISPNWEETPEGYLRIKATFARTGLQRYRRHDGSEAVEYRPEEEVSKQDSLLSLANLPVTLEHPPELLTPETCREHQRGFTGSMVEYRSPFALGFVTVTDRDAIDAIKRRDSTEISVGYRVRYDPTPGVTPDGQRYDGVQREISGNHVAIVRKGRAGPEVRLHMDAAYAVDPIPGDDTSKPQQEDDMTAVAALSNATEALANALSAQVRADAKGKKNAMPVMEDEETREGSEEMEEEEMEMNEEEEMDGGAANLGSYKIPKKDGMVPKAMYDKACAERDDAIAAHERDLGRLDALVDRIDSLEQEIDSRVDAADIDVDSLVASRIDLLDRATTILGERPTFDGLTDREIMVDALVQAGMDPERFEGRSDDYVAATFDTYAEAAAGRIDSADPLAVALGGVPMASNGQDDARAQMIRAQQENSRRPLTVTKGA